MENREYEGGLYHVLSRGNERKDIFHDDRDHLAFLNAVGEMADNYKEEPVQQLQQAITQTVEKLVLIKQNLQSGMPFWGKNLLTTDEHGSTQIIDYPSSSVSISGSLEATKVFLESMQAYSSPGKLKNFRYDAGEVSGHRDGLKALNEVELLQELLYRFIFIIIC